MGGEGGGGGAGEASSGERWEGLLIIMPCRVLYLLPQLVEKNSRIIKNYAIWLRYDSRSGTHNMYREYRDLTLTGAVDQLCEYYHHSIYTSRDVGASRGMEAGRG